MSLFREIRRLCLSDKEQHEDTLTEIVAEVLRNSPELTKQWLYKVGVAGLMESEVAGIETQYRLPGLAEHDTSSRIDLVITLSTPRGRKVIFVESKVGSQQGSNQLQRYAELLAAECRERKAEGCLVFITRDFELAEAPSVKSFNFEFRTARWFQFYQILKSRSSSDGLEKQLMLFMEENHMKVGNQFRSTDLVALENFLAAKAMMDSTLEVVSEKMRAMFNRGGRIHKAMGQLRLYRRYALITNFGGMECLAGYWLPNLTIDEPIWVGVMLTCNPNGKDRERILTAFRKLVDRHESGWAGDNLDSVKEWASIYNGKTISAFLGEEDQKVAIGDYLNKLLGEVEDFRTANPDLPWVASESPEAETEE